MATSFDQPLIYSPISKKDTGELTYDWNHWFSTFFQTLIEYLSENGIFIPQMTTAQRDAIQSPVEGQLIYNTDAILGPRTAQLQVWQVKAGVAGWHVITTV